MYQIGSPTRGATLTLNRALYVLCIHRLPYTCIRHVLARKIGFCQVVIFIWSSEIRPGERKATL